MVLIQDLKIIFKMKFSSRFWSGDPEFAGVEDDLPLVDVQRDGQRDGATVG